MNKILVEIYLPLLQTSFDVYIPLTSQLHEIEPLVVRAFNDVTSGYVNSSDELVLCDRDSGKVLDINQTALELALKNGSRLMLI